MKTKVMRLKEVQEWTGLSRSTIDRLEATGQFPKRRQISATRVGWSSAEIEAWFEERREKAKDSLRRFISQLDKRDESEVGND